MAEIVIAGAAIVSAGVSVANTVEQRKQARVQRQAAQFEEAKSRRQVIARARALRAETVAQAESQGVAQGSSAQGAVSSIQQQAADTISFQNNIRGFNNQINRSQQRMNNMSTLGDLANASAQVAGTFNNEK